MAYSLDNHSNVLPFPATRAARDEDVLTRSFGESRMCAKFLHAIEDLLNDASEGGTVNHAYLSQLIGGVVRNLDGALDEIEQLRAKPQVCAG